MIDCEIENIIYNIKTIDLDTEIFAKKIMIAPVFEMDVNDIYEKNY